jgi:hypothetical protein
VATFAATGVDFHNATDLALQLAARYQVWDRPEGLKGVLHNMIEEWLDALLPLDDDDDVILLPESVNGGQLSVLVTPVPFLWEKERITSRQDLVDFNLASIYLPFFSNGGLWANFGIDCTLMVTFCPPANTIDPRKVIKIMPNEAIPYF